MPPEAARARRRDDRAGTSRSRTSAGRRAPAPHHCLQLGEPALLASHEIDRRQVDGRGLLAPERLPDGEGFLAPALGLGEPAPEAGDLRVRKLAQPALHGLPQGLLEAVARRQLGVSAGRVPVLEQAGGAVHVGLDRLLDVPARLRGRRQLVDRAQAFRRGPEASEGVHQRAQHLGPRRGVVSRARELGRLPAAGKDRIRAREIAAQDRLARQQQRAQGRLVGPAV